MALTNLGLLTSHTQVEESVKNKTKQKTRNSIGLEKQNRTGQGVLETWQREAPLGRPPGSASYVVAPSLLMVSS